MTTMPSVITAAIRSATLFRESARVAVTSTPAPARRPRSAVSRNVVCSPKAGRRTNPAASAPAMAPNALNAYTRAVSRLTVAAPADAAARARGNSAPRAIAPGSTRRPTENACTSNTRPNDALGSATTDATMSGSFEAAYQAPSDEAAAVATSIAASHVVMCDDRRATRAPAVDPIASPRMNDATIVANA